MKYLLQFKLEKNSILIHNFFSFVFERVPLETKQLVSTLHVYFIEHWLNTCVAYNTLT